MKEAKWRLADIDKNIKYMENEYEATKEADALVIITEWYQFRSLDFDRIKSNMSGKELFDLRNIYASRDGIRDLFNYHGVGLGR